MGGNDVTEGLPDSEQMETFLAYIEEGHGSKAKLKGRDGR